MSEPPEYPSFVRELLVSCPQTPRGAHRRGISASERRAERLEKSSVSPHRRSAIRGGPQ